MINKLNEAIREHFKIAVKIREINQIIRRKVLEIGVSETFLVLALHSMMSIITLLGPPPRQRCVDVFR
jgi:hypothetical protein